MRLYIFRQIKVSKKLS